MKPGYDQCRNCSARGDISACAEADCGLHQSWIVQTLAEEMDLLRRKMETIKDEAADCVGDLIWLKIIRYLANGQRGEP